MVAIAALIGGIYAYLDRSPLINLFGNSHNLEIVASPSRVEAYRLVDPTEGRLPSGDWELPNSPLEYEIGAGPVILDDQLAAQIAKALTVKQSYVWDSGKACAPVYGLKLSFLQASERIDVYFCFACDFLTVVNDGKEAGSEDFDNARATFVRAAKRSFPDDEVIQRLSE